VSVALGVQNAIRMGSIFFWGLSGSTVFPHLKRYDFWK